MTIKLDKEILINLDAQTIKSAIKDLDFCIEMIRENLVSDIEIYQELKNLKGKKQFAVKNLARTLSIINQSPGWIYFINLFSITKEKPEDITITDVLPILNESHLPTLPWTNSQYCFLFDNPTEEVLLNPGEYQLKHENLIGKVIGLDFENNEIAKRMSTGLNREKHIYDLYLYICLAECFGLPVKLMEFSQDMKLKNISDNPFIDGEPIKDYVKNILNKHYKKTKKIVESQKIFPEQINPDDVLWEDLKNKSIELRNEVLKIKNNYLEAISGYKFEEKYSVFNDIWSFLIKNNLEEFVPPSISLLQSEKYKEFGLVKKISNGPSMSTVREEYTPWVINQKNSAASVNMGLKSVSEIAKIFSIESSTVLDIAKEIGIALKDENSILSPTNEAILASRIKATKPTYKPNI